MTNVRCTITLIGIEALLDQDNQLPEIRLPNVIKPCDTDLLTQRSAQQRLWLIFFNTLENNDKLQRLKPTYETGESAEKQ